MIRRLAKTCCWYISWVEQHHTEFMFNLHITQSNQHHEHIFLEQTDTIIYFYISPLVGATSANQHHINIFLEQTDMINNFYFIPLVGATWADQHHTEFMFNPPRRVSGQRSSLPFSDRRQLHLSKCAVSKYWCFLHICGWLSLLFSLSSKQFWLFSTIAPNLGENVELRSVSISICCHSRWKVPIQTC